MIVNIKTLTLLTPFFLASCSLAPEYLRPDFSAAMFWKASDKRVEKKQKTQPVAWESYYAAPELRRIVGIALEHNADVKQAALNVKEARAQFKVTRADLIPSVNAEGAATIGERSDASSLGRNFPVDSYSASLAVPAYTLDLFGAVQSRTASEYEKYIGAVYAADAAALSVIAETASAYVQLLVDRKLLRLTERTLKSRENTFDILVKSRDLGVAPEQDVARAETAVETTRANLHLYQRMVEQDVNALFILLGVPRNDDLLPTGDIDDGDFMKDLAPGLPSDVLLSRPDVMQAEHALKAAGADIGAARAAFFPSISLTGAYGYASLDLSDLFTSAAADAWSFSPNITVPIFQGGRLKSALKIAEIRQEKAVVAYEEAIRQAFREVSNVLNARETLTKQSNAQTRLVKAARKAYNLSKMRYDSGVDSFLSLLDAQRELYAFEQSALILEAERLATLARIYAIFGGRGIVKNASSDE